MQTHPWLLLPLAASLVACTSAPAAPLPQPLPETLEWAVGDGTSPGAFLGLRTRENLGDSLDELDFRAGLLVTRVVENSPAEEAGLRVGDVLLSLAGHETDDVATLDALLENEAPGREVELEVQRGDTVFGVDVVLRERVGERPETAEALYRMDPARSRAGWLTGRGGVVLVSSHDDGPFPRAGVAVGSVVRAVDGREVLSDRGLIRRLQRLAPGTAVDVDYTDPGGAHHRARVELQDQPRRITRFSLPVLIGYHADLAGDETSLVLVDLWLVSLFRYERQGEERSWRILRFIRFSTGVGELAG